MAGGRHQDTEGYQKKVWKKFGKDYIVVSDYINKSTPIMIVHMNDGHPCDASPFAVIPHFYTRNKNGCKKCAKLERVRSKEEFNRELNDLGANCYLNTEYKGYNEECEFVCTICNLPFSQTPKKILNQLKTSDTPCYRCSDGKSYPEKFFLEFLHQLNIPFIYQFDSAKGASWAKEYRYDFYISEKNMIIEVHGLQHYRQTIFHKLEEVQETDRIKKQLALENGFIYVVIDARKSTIDHISKSIKKSLLNKEYDLSVINWAQCGKKAASSKFIEACELYNSGTTVYDDIAAQLDISKVTVGRYIRDAFQYNICQKQPNKRKKGKAIRCVETGEVYDYVADANTALGRKRTTSTIHDCLKHKTKTAFGYHWEYIK